MMHRRGDRMVLTKVLFCAVLGWKTTGASRYPWSPKATAPKDATVKKVRGLGCSLLV